MTSTGGAESQDQTRNLMDYTTGKELAAFQWNVLANPAVFTAADNKSQGDLVRRKKALVTLKMEGLHLMARLFSLSRLRIVTISLL